MTSLAVTIPSNMSAMVNAKIVESSGTNLIVKPITDIREKGRAKSMAMEIVELRNDIKALRMRESNLSGTTEIKNENIKAKMSTIQINGNVRGSFEGKNVDVVDSLHKTQDTNENSPTGYVSREEKVLKESQRKNLPEKVENFERIKLLNIKTDANDHHENSLDTGTHLAAGMANDDVKNCCEGLAEKCVGVTLDGSENFADNLEVSQKNGITAKTTGTVATPVRPKTLATSANSLPKGTQTSPLGKLTPRTPNSTPQYHNSLHHLKSAFHHSLPRKNKNIPSEVPRTTATITTTTTANTNAKLTPKTPPVTPDSPATYLDDDVDSIYSFATSTSGLSTMSCEHAYVAHNGTTFSARKNKFVVHNSQYAGLVGSAYITPTQRARNQIQKLKGLLRAMQQEINQKNDEILRFTREVAELRLFKASLNSPEERSASSDAVTVREAELQTSQDVSPIVVDTIDDAIKSSPCHIANTDGQQHYQSYLEHQQNVMQRSSDMQSSFADSGHFEDMTSLSVHSKDSYAANSNDGGDNERDGAVAITSNVADAVAAAEREVEVQRQELIRMYEQRIEELIRNQDVATTEMKRIHNDKIEALLQKLSECNTRYADIVPDYEVAKERIRELEIQLDDLQHKLFDHEERQNKMYLHMYQKGQEAERIARADQALELAYRAPNNHVSINELLHQLQSTQEELDNIRATECRNESGSSHALLTAKEAISLWVLGARKTIYRRLLEAQKNRTQVDPEVTLQFLKSAVYYFLTDKENSQGHLQAIESILEFTEAEKQNINQARATK